LKRISYGLLGSPLKGISFRMDISFGRKLRWNEPLWKESLWNEFFSEGISPSEGSFFGMNLLWKSTSEGTSFGKNRLRKEPLWKGTLMEGKSFLRTSYGKKFSNKL
jgi:hypothetical protein